MRLHQFLICILSVLALFALNSCRHQELSDIKTDTWYISGEGQIALKFQCLKEPLRGVYVVCDRAVSEAMPFNADWDGNELEFFFQGNTSLNLKGKISTEKDYFIITNKNKKKDIFKVQASKPFPGPPYRYKSAVFDKVSVQEQIYGHAPGFYSSKPMAEIGQNNYVQIITDVAKSISGNILTTEIPLAMDIYMPSGDTLRNRPLLLLIHGGAFIIGDKKNQFAVRLANYYARCGFVVASVNYRMGYVFLPGVYSNTERCMYKALQDIRASLRFLSANHQQYGIDQNMVFVGGNSAGGFLSLFTAFIKDDEVWSSAKGNKYMLQKDLGCLECSTNNSQGNWSLAGVISLWGAVHELYIIDLNKKVPVLLIHGDSDRIVPYTHNYPFANLDPTLTSVFMEKVYGSKPIYDKMRNLGFDVTLRTIKGGGHEPQTDENGKLNYQYDTIKNDISNFMYKILYSDSLHISEPEDISKTNKPARYAIPNTNNCRVIWSCTGGIIVKEEMDWADVVWFTNQEAKKIKVAATNKMGVVRIGEKNILK